MASLGHGEEAIPVMPEGGLIVIGIVDPTLVASPACRPS
jgi:hypothetical protein